MDEFELYKNNLDIVDKRNYESIPVDRKLVFNSVLNPVKKSHESHFSQESVSADTNKLNHTAHSNVNNLNNTISTEVDAQAEYLNAKSTSYLVVGKPGIGSYSIGEALSKKFSCVHLCPENIIHDECYQNSVTGQCMDFNLRHNNVLKINYILKIIRQKIESPCIKHRGYVISGFPLITTNQGMEYYFYTPYAEESVTCAQEIVIEIFSNVENHIYAGINESELIEEQDITVDAEEQEKDNLINQKLFLKTCENVFVKSSPIMVSKFSVFIDQMKLLFDEHIKPNVLIYLMCPDEDVVTKRNHKFFDYSNCTYIQIPFPSKLQSFNRWPAHYCSDLIHIDHYQEFQLQNMKYFCKQPINNKEHCMNQLFNYKNYIESYIENKIKDYDPMYLIRLNSCTSLSDMMHNIIQRMQFMPINCIVNPTPFTIIENENENEIPEDTEEFWKFVSSMKIIENGNNAFVRKPSLWFNRCPVELKYGRTVKGRTRYAVTFMKHVYLLSSLHYSNLFCENPRPFLKMDNLLAKCRVIVIGTQHSGKSMVSECLAWLFDAPVLSYDMLVEKQKKDKYYMYAQNILSELKDTIMEGRLNIWQSLENIRITKLQHWWNQLHGRIQEFINLSQKPSINSKKLKIIKSKLKHVIPFVADIKLCKKALRDESMLLEYAPVDLLQVNPEPSTPMLGDKDVMEAVDAYINDHELQKQILPTPEELLQDIWKFCISQDEKIQRSTNSEKLYGNWIIDGFPSALEYWNILMNMELLPDYTVSLMENREFNYELIEYYYKIQRAQKMHHERFILVNDTFIQSKSLNKAFTMLSLEQNMEIIVLDVINNVLQILDLRDTAAVDKIKELGDAVHKFKEDWESLKLFLKENFKSHIGIELDGYTDIQVLEEVLFKLRIAYNLICVPPEDDDKSEVQAENIETKDILTWNDPKFMCETNSYCIVAFHKYGILWRGKQDISIQYDNKLYMFCKYECLESFQKDPAEFRLYNEPFQTIPPLKICLIGCIGSGKTTLSKLISKELGLIHIDFSEIVNELVMPKHAKKVGFEFENIFTEDVTENDTEAGIPTENELRGIVFNYFEHGTALPSDLLQKLLKTLWFEEPYRSLGFILNGFPRTPSDIETMVTCFCVPELILQITANFETAVDQKSSKMIKKWTFQLEEAQNLHKIKIDTIKQQRLDLITREIVIKHTLEAIIQNVFYEEPIAAPIWQHVKDPSLESVNSCALDPDSLKLYNELVEKYPEPIDERIWETREEACERIKSRIEAIYQVQNGNLERMMEIIAENNIPIVTIDGDESKSKVLQNTLLELTKVINKNESFFEQTFVITVETADTLLSEGLYLLSKFYHMCPVYFHENPSSIINPYLIAKNNDEIFPVIHRSYIYFTCTKKNLHKFRNNPLKYIYNNKITLFSYFPLRLAIIGPPKSGKSTLTSKFVEKYGLLPISRGLAIRYVLHVFWWTELAKKIIKCLSIGKTIDYSLIVQAVQVVCFNHRAATHGIIFDGFPYNASEATTLSKIGLYPLAIFDIHVKKEKLLKNVYGDINCDVLKIVPPHSVSLTNYKYAQWDQKKNNIRDWLMDNCENNFILDGKASKWHCWMQSNNFVTKMISAIHNYLLNKQCKSVCVDDVGVSLMLAETKLSNIKMICPVCYSQNAIRQVRHTTDRKGLMQYKGLFYWVCGAHTDIFRTNPDVYTSLESVVLPEIPAAVSHIDTTLVYESGICIVTYATNLPAQIIKPGSSKYAVTYNRNIYLFCSFECQMKFMERPHLYYDISVLKNIKGVSKIAIDKLPHLGYLEQSLGNILTNACCYLNVLRPKYPGLPIHLSGLIYLGLYLKIYNPLTNPTYLSTYIKQLQVYEARCKLVKDLGLKLRAMTNPFIKYPHVCHIESSIATIEESHSLISTQSVHQDLCICCKCFTSASNQVFQNEDDICLCCKCDDSLISIALLKYNKCNCVIRGGSFS